MSEQALAGAQISGPLVEDRDLGSPQAVGAVIRWVEADQTPPLVDETPLLPRSDVLSAMARAWPEPVTALCSPDREPRGEGVFGPFDDLEENRLPGLVLDDHHVGGLHCHLAALAHRYGAAEHEIQRILPVHEAHFEAWLRFGEGMFVKLACHLEGLEHWWAGLSRPDRPKETLCARCK